ncbi:MAG: hypothetical protein COT84_04280 [Chlamydiae bacterium CG10_big_fil_rev_8_21_14_0_10_35_9]|nr:MAG: hypothetical protein COT84_04280 [Chlamydiae bacterium CG10_big_fil_rev_8_21_14_0_10_35_9]
MKAWLILFNVIIATNLAIISAVTSAVAESSIIGDLGIEGSVQQWVTILYFLGVNSAVPIGNWLGDRFGYKRMYFIGVSFFILGSFFVGLSSNFHMIVASRFIEGIGAGLIFPVGLALIMKNFPKEKLSLPINLYLGLSFGGGIGLGSIISGYFAQAGYWQACFFMNIPFGIFCLIATYYEIKETEKIDNGKFDFWGYLTFIIFVATLLIALTQGNLVSTTNGWKSPLVVGCLISCIVALIVWIFIEKKTSNPIISLKMFKYPLFVMACLSVFAIGSTLFATVSLASQYMEVSLKFQKQTTGLMLSIYGLALATFTMFSTFLMKHIHTLLVVLTGLCFLAISLFMNNELTFLSNKTHLAMILILRGMGIGLSLGPITSNGLKNIPLGHTAQAAMLLTFFRQTGATYGGSILNIIIIRRQFFHSQTFGEQITNYGIGFQETLRKMTSFFSFYHGNSPTEAKERAKQVIIDNVKNQSLIQSINDALFIFGIVICCIGFLLIFLNIKRQKEKPIP